jgi:hypothetical protein
VEEDDQWSLAGDPEADSVAVQGDLLERELAARGRLVTHR